MKKYLMYIICFLCVISVMGIAFYFGYETNNLNFQDKYMDGGSDSNNNSGNLYNRNSNKNNTISVAKSGNSFINQDARFVIQDYNITNNSMNEYEYKVPMEFTGLTLEEVQSKIDEYNDNMPITENQMINYSLVTFLPDNVVIRKTYRTTDDSTYLFWVKDVCGFVVVYKADKQVVFVSTEIQTKYMPEQEQKLLKAGKEIKGIQNLFNYLEGYTT